MSENTDVERVDSEIQCQASPPELLNRAIENGADVETLSALVDLHERLAARQARQAYIRAMSQFQAECPTIKKSKKGYNFKYAPLESIIEQVQHLLEECGLSYRVDTTVDGQIVSATVEVTHEEGHSERSTMAIPIDPNDNSSMNLAQQFATAHTYAKRYAFCDAFGIMTGDEDTAGGPPKNTGQAPQSRQPQGNSQQPAGGNQSQSEPKPPDKLSEDTRKKLHAVGTELYGEGWNSKRHTLCETVTRGATSSSNDLTPAQAHQLIEGIEKKLNEQPRNEIADSEIPQ